MNIKKLRFFIAIPLAALIFSPLIGCKKGASQDNELASKNEYSVLQSYEYKYREESNATPYIIEKNALSSGADVIGLPVKGRTEGYVWLIASPNSTSSVLVLPADTSFEVNSSTLQSLEKSVTMSPATVGLIKKALSSEK